ncbi:MAG: tetratricopeptide repeat protein [Ignavibacteria bacterium]|nr:tetratricopeptide repeat protein [Ignavibacteria bacterium]
MKSTLTTLILILFFLINLPQAKAQQTPEDILTKANEYFLQGDFQNAIIFFTDFLKSYPQHFAALDNRGLSYLALKDYGRAIDDFSSAIRVNKSSSMSYVYRALAYQGKNNLPSAKKDYEDAMFYDVSNLEAYYGLNMLYVGNKEYERSLKLLEKATALDPKSSRSYFLKAITHTFKKDTAKIFENVAEGLSWDSTYYLKNTSKDLVFVKAERFKSALNIFSQLISKDPKSYLAYFNRGMIYYMMGSNDKAESDLKKSKSLNKNPTELETTTTDKLIRACYRLD